jgi:myo-inositol 2-dehydrogenase/D-chiro-inositol 1-dehydrogenase
VINLAIVGAGTIGRLHAENVVRHLPGARIAAIVDPDEGRGRTVAALAPDAGVTTDLDRMLRDSDIDAVIVGAPTREHAAIIRAAASAGKHVFCEKPIALTLDDANSAVEAARTNRVKLQLGFQRRFDSAYERVREAVACGELGAVEMLISTTRDPVPPRPGYLESCGGMFLDTAIHDYDSVRFLAGSEVVEVYASASNLVAPERRGPFDIDTAMTVLRLASGALATVTNSLRTGYGYEAGAEVYGSNGKAVIGAEAGGVQRFAGGAMATPLPRTYAERFAAAYREELAAFVRAIVEDSEPRCTGEDGLRALEIALAATRSQREGQPVRL